MKQNESAITIIAVALGICVTTLLVFANFSLAYLVKLFAEGRVPASRAFVMFAVTAANVGILGYLLRSWLQGIRTSVKQEVETARASRPNHPKQWQMAREKVLELAQAQSSFNVQQVMELTEFNRTETEYLLDELLSQNLLSVTQEAETFSYSLKSQTLSKVP